MNRVLKFQISGRLIFGLGAVQELPGAVRQAGGRKALFVTDPGVVRAGVLERVETALRVAEVSCATFDRVEADPSIECARAAVAGVG